MTSEFHDAGLLQRNGDAYARKHGKAREVLSKANGTLHYTAISKITSVPSTTVSSLLRLAARLNLATKVKAGIYKKNPGSMAFVSRHAIRNTGESRSNKVQRLSRMKTTKMPSTSLFNGEPEKMAKAYSFLYLTENELREVIRHAMASHQNWWNSCVPVGIKKSVALAQQEEKYTAVKRKDELEYTHLGQLQEIICRKDNWKDISVFFKEKDKETVRVTLVRAIPLRNAIAHSITLKKQDLIKAEIRFQDILDMLN